MGRLMDALREKSESGPVAIPAIPAIPAIFPVAGFTESQNRKNRSGGESEKHDGAAVLPLPVAAGGIAESQESQRARLLALAEPETLPLVHGLPDADVTACTGYTDADLLGYLRTLSAGERMDAGMTPVEWGTPHARTCEACGPVLLWETCPDVVKACPWCFRRKAGKPIARPRVQVSNGVLNGYTDPGVTPAMREALRAMRERDK
ncbi:MAG: hypothetical protein QM599_03110 [Pseudoxanthomonas sp.]